MGLCVSEPIREIEINIERHKEIVVDTDDKIVKFVLRKSFNRDKFYVSSNNEIKVIKNNERIYIKVITQIQTISKIYTTTDKTINIRTKPNNKGIKKREINGGECFLSLFYDNYRED